MERVSLRYPYLDRLETEIKQKFIQENQIHILLQETLFSPDKPGELTDSGCINDIPVTRVYLRDGHPVHVLDRDILTKSVELSIDINRRIDLIQQHTAARLLQGLLEKLYALEVTGYHISQKDAYLELSSLSGLREGWPENIEVLAQQAIARALPLEKIFLSTPNARPNFQQQVTLPGVFSCTCENVLAENSGELFALRITHVDKEGRDKRIHFLCGQRCFSEYQTIHRQISHLSRLMDIPPADCLDQVTHQQEKMQLLSKENEQFREKNFSLTRALLEKSKEYTRGFSLISSYYDEPFDQLTELGQQVQANFILLTDKGGRVYLRVSEEKFNLDPLLDLLSEEYRLEGSRTRLGFEGHTKEDPEAFLSALKERILQHLR